MIYKYFSYFSDDVVDKIRVMLAGGESAKQLNNERKVEIKYLKMIKNLSNFMKTINKNIKKKQITLSGENAINYSAKELVSIFDTNKASKEAQLEKQKSC